MSFCWKEFNSNLSPVNLEPTSENELKRLVRLIKANPQLNFEIQVMLNGYEEDSVRSSDDLTEVLVDSIKTQIDDIDSLGQLYKRDTIVSRTLYHNNRTQLQANSIVEYIAKSGIDTTDCEDANECHTRSAS